MAYTKDKFLMDIMKMNLDNDKYENKAFESIVYNLFLQNKWGKEKISGVDEYDSELSTKLTLIPGHIYAFKYMATHTTKYDDGKIKFEYSDTLPIILCTYVDKEIIKGINLNLCNYGLRALILNDIYNLDPEFFNHDAAVQVSRGISPVSRNISMFFAKKDNQEKFINYIKTRYKLSNTAFIFRSYSISKIKQIRFIEPWQWQYIPFINYKQSVKTSVLLLIQHITGIDKIKI